jgi:predicted MFS family arabinose efflux permease
MWPNGATFIFLPALSDVATTFGVTSGTAAMAVSMYLVSSAVSRGAAHAPPVVSRGSSQAERPLGKPLGVEGALT